MIKIFKKDADANIIITPVISKDVMTINNNNEDIVIEIGHQDLIENLRGALTYIDSQYEEKVDIVLDLKDFNLDIESVIECYLLSFFFIKSINILVKAKYNIENMFIDVNNKLEEIKKIKKESCNNDSKLLEVRLKTFFNLFDDTTKKILNKTYKKHSIELEGKRCIVIDNHNFFHRTYHGYPDLRDSQGRPTNVLKGLMILIKDILLEKPDFIIFANEGTKNVNVRKDIYPEYKNKRLETPEDLKLQINLSIDLLEKMGFCVLEKKGYEADDIIASVAKLFSSKGCFVKIISTDKDLYQILDDNDNNLISIYNPDKKKFISEEDCIKKFGVGFDLCLFVQALMGDPVDDVPGIKGVGPSNASKLLKLYGGSLEELFKHKDDIGGKLGENVRNQEKEAYLSLKLVTLYNNLINEEEIESMIAPSEPFTKIINELNDYSINI